MSQMSQSHQLPNLSPEYANQQWIPSPEEYLSEKVAQDSNKLRMDLDKPGPAPWQLITNDLSAGRAFSQGTFGGVERGLPPHFFTQGKDLNRQQVDESMVGAETVPGVEYGVSMEQAMNLSGAGSVTPYASTQMTQ